MIYMYFFIAVFFRTKIGIASRFGRMAFLFLQAVIHLKVN